jgi:hypothetical protein
MAEHKSLSDAISDCMHAIKPLMKGETNTHGSYNFASVDDFLNLTRPICAKHRLVILQDEEACEITNGQVFIRYAFTLHHGAEMAGPFRRSIAVNSKMGSQAFGAAQSYALKQFLRSLFQISTGEKDDIDFHKPEQLADQKPARARKWDTPITGKSALHKALTALQRDLEGCGDTEMVYALTATKEWKDFVTTAEEHAPHYLRGGDPAPPEFEGILNTAERMVREFDSATAQGMVDLGRA